MTNILLLLGSFLGGRREEPAAEVPHAWGTYYVSAFQPELEKIAGDLSVGRRVLARFNTDRVRVELYDFRTREVLASVAVHGEGGVAEKAIVETSLPESARKLFTDAFPFEVEFRSLAKVIVAA